MVEMKEESQQTWRNTGSQLASKVLRTAKNNNITTNITVPLLRLPVQGHARAMAPAGDVSGGGGGPAKTAGTGRRTREEAGRADPQVGRTHQRLHK